MNILITGSTSFLGLAITKRLIDDGHEIFAIVRPLSLNFALLPNSKSLHIIKSELSDFFECADLPKMDVCLHLAWAAPGLAGRMNECLQKENYENTVSVIKIASRLSCKTFIFFGSQCEYGINAERIKCGEFSNAPVTEETACKPISFYAKEKLNVLNNAAPIAMALGLKYIHLRFFSVYGPNEHASSLISTCINASLYNKEASLGLCNQLWNYLFIDDCADIVSLLVSKSISDKDKNFVQYPSPLVINCASLDTRILSEFTEEIFRTFGGKGVYKNRQIGAEGTVFLNPSTEKLYRLTGWTPKTFFSEGIKKCHEFAKSNLI